MKLNIILYVVVVNGLERMRTAQMVCELPVALRVIVRVTRASNLWGGGHQNPPEMFFQQKHGNLSRNLEFFGFENFMINLYEKTE